MCSEQPEVTLRQLTINPEYAFDCLQALVSRLLVRREMTPEQAMEYCGEPLEGEFRKALKRSWTPHNKESPATGKGKSSKGRPAKNSKDKQAESGPSGSTREEASGSRSGADKNKGNKTKQNLY